MQRHSTLTLTVIVLATCVLGLRLHVGSPVAHAAQTWGVQVGGDPTAGVTAINFYPRSLTIAVGDTVNYSFPALEPHSLTFDDGGSGLFPGDFSPDSPSRGDLDVTKAFSPFNVDGSSATYDGSQVIASGAPLDPPDQRVPFAVTFTKPGVFHFECAIHGPVMEGDVIVAAAGSSLPETPAQVDARASTDMANDLSKTLAQTKLFPLKPMNIAGPAGATIHTLSAGAVGSNTSIAQFLPRDITVKRGDYVVWNQPDVNEFHTVTFLSGAPTPAFFQLIPSASGPPRFVLPFSVNAPSGGSTYTGTGIVNSGAITSGNSYTLKIDAPPGTYQYVCLFHVDLYDHKGTITVTP